MGDTLPMFPLNSVLFPGMSVPLRVFEDRYRALVHHLLRVEDPTERERLWHLADQVFPAYAAYRRRAAAAGRQIPLVQLTPR